MGYEVIAFGTIEFNENEVNKELIKKILTLLDEDECVLNHTIEVMGDYITFQMSGNKGIDYEGLDKIKELLSKEGVYFQISTSEFSECGDGYYYDSEEK